MNQLILNCLKKDLAKRIENDYNRDALYGHGELQLRDGIVYAVIKTHSVNPMKDELPDPPEGVKRFWECDNSTHEWAYDCVPLN